MYLRLKSEKVMDDFFPSVVLRPSKAASADITPRPWVDDDDDDDDDEGTVGDKDDETDAEVVVKVNAGVDTDPDPDADAEHMPVPVAATSLDRNTAAEGRVANEVEPVGESLVPTLAKNDKSRLFRHVRDVRADELEEHGPDVVEQAVKDKRWEVGEAAPELLALFERALRVFETASREVGPVV
ncbi:hypothetical protein BGZ65_012364 [Modicella reniformis]|uniref:Uncharacterized protein n=1 Tax=Modicella reniformis TaxID=1440133 RepID=A0A9P6SUN6_9FUNG|nr:hypothetical protein BGZ65_012364 [Modicella reniformis]